MLHLFWPQCRHASRSLEALVALLLNRETFDFVLLGLITKYGLPRSSNKWRIAALAALGMAACLKPEHQAS